MMASGRPWWLCGTQVACAHRTSHGGSSSLALSPRVDVQPRWWWLILLCTADVHCKTCWSVCPSPPPAPRGSWCAPRRPPTASSPPSSSSSQRSTAACGSSPGCLVGEEAPSPVKVLQRLKMRTVISKPQCLVSRVLPSLPLTQFWGWPSLPDRCPCWPAFYSAWLIF